MSDRQWYSVTVQFLVQGWGTDEDMDRRQDLEDRVGKALGVNGASSGAGGGSGTMDISFSVTNREVARKKLVSLFDQIGDPEDTVVVCSASSEDDESGEETVWWPANYPYRFGMFGPTWKGPLPESELAELPGDLRAIQGEWRVVRYDGPDGSKSSEWSDQLRFLFVRDLATVRHGMSIISHARFRVDPAHLPKHLDVHPILGSNKGGVAYAVYELAGDVLQICTASPGEDRPAALLPEAEHQPGRMVLHREKSPPESSKSPPETKKNAEKPSGSAATEQQRKKRRGIVELAALLLAGLLGLWIGGFFPENSGEGPGKKLGKTAKIPVPPESHEPEVKKGEIGEKPPRPPESSGDLPRPKPVQRETPLVKPLMKPRWPSELEAIEVIKSIGGSVAPEVGPIERVNLNYCGAKDFHLSYVRAFRKLENLSLIDGQITDKGLAYLEDVPTLENLKLSQDKVTGRGIQVLARLPQLISLQLSPKKESFLAEDFQVIGTCPRLEQLTIHLTELPAGSLRFLGSLPYLDYLDLSDAKVTDQHFDDIVECNSITWLNLQSNPITGKSLKKLGRLPRLATLNLSGIETLSDDDLKSLRDCRQLKTIDIRFTKITEQGVIHLKEAPNLKFIGLEKARLTSKVKDAFAKDRPEVKFFD